MKYFSFSLILLVLLFSSCKKEKETITGYPTTPTFFTFEGEIGTNDNSTIVTSDNNLVVCGNENSGIFLLKISKAGNQIWRKNIISNIAMRAYSVVETSNHDLLICGRIIKTGSPTGWDVLLIKTNSTGDTLWSKNYGGSNDEYGYQIIKTSDDNYLISAENEADVIDTDIFLIKINVDGDTLWTRTYSDPGSENTKHLLQTQNGEYLITGVKSDRSLDGIYFLKVDATGNKLWDKTIGLGTDKYGYSSVELSNGDLLTCGNHEPTHKTVLLKTDNTGNVYWEKQLGEGNYLKRLYSIINNSDGTFTIAGSEYREAPNWAEILLFKVDQNGNQIWYKKFGSTRFEVGVNLIKSINGDNIITGTANIFEGFNTINGIFMTKTDDYGNFK